MQGPAVALGEVKPPGRLLCPATPASFLSVGSGRPLSSLQSLCMIVSACIEFSFSSGFLFLFLYFSFFFPLLVFDVRVFIDFHCMAHIPFIYLHKPLNYFHMPFMYLTHYLCTFTCHLHTFTYRVHTFTCHLCTFMCHLCTLTYHLCTIIIQFIYFLKSSEVKL